MAFKNAKIYGKFYSPERVLSYNRPWIFVLGSRSIGKSTAIGMYMIKKYLTDGSKFIYVRRTEDETLNTCRTFFDNSVRILQSNGYNIKEFKYDRRNYYIKLDGEEEFTQCGTIIPLSQEYKYKSANYEDYNTILYDEFISRDPNKYLGSKNSLDYEYDCCLSLYQTVDRGVGQSFQNKTTFIFSANNSSYFNPLFVALGITDYLRTDTKILAPKGKMWILEQVQSVEGTSEIEKSYGYQLANEKNKDYAYNNVGFDQKLNFVEKLNKPMEGILNMKYNGHIMGVYLEHSEGIIYICNKPNKCYTLALTTGDQDKINYTMALRFNENHVLKTIKDAYYNGNVIFETNKCRYEIANYFMLTP